MARNETACVRLPALSRRTLRGGAALLGASQPLGVPFIANARAADVAGLRPTTFVGCVITAPAISPLVVAARGLACPSSVGGDMFQAERVLMFDFLQGAE